MILSLDFCGKKHLYQLKLFSESLVSVGFIRTRVPYLWCLSCIFYMNFLIDRQYVFYFLWAIYQNDYGYFKKGLRITRSESIDLYTSWSCVRQRLFVPFEETTLNLLYVCVNDKRAHASVNLILKWLKVSGNYKSHCGKFLRWP